MKVKFLLSSLLILFTIFLQAQEIRLGVSDNTISSWEQIINQQGNIDKDTVAVKKFLQPLKERNSETDKILHDALLANAYANSFDRINEKSNFHFSNSIENAKKSKFKALEIWATLSYAEYIYKFREITKALPIYMSAIEKIDQLDPKDVLFPGESFTQIGFYMGTIGDHTETIKYLNKAKQYTKSNSSAYATILDNLGMYYLKIGDLKNAEKNIQEASDLAKSIGDEIRYAKTLGNLAQIHEINRDYTSAIKMIVEDIEISDRKGNDQNTMYAYTVLARLFIANNQIEEAKIAVRKADDIAKTKSYFKINELEILKLKLKIIYKEGRGDEELLVRRRIGVLEDSLNKTDGVLPLNQANWMLQKRKYQQNIIATKKKLESESFWKNIIFTVTGLLIFFVLLVVIDAKIRERKKQLQNEQKILEYENSKLRIEQKLTDAHKTLDSQIDFLKEKNIEIQKLHTEIEKSKESKFSSKEDDHRKLHDLLQSHLMTEENWRIFKNEFQREYFDFYEDLLHNFPEVTDSNLRIILLQKLGFTNAEIAGLLGITIEAVKKSKQRLKRKLGEKYDLLFNMITSEN